MAPPGPSAKDASADGAVASSRPVSSTGTTGAPSKKKSGSAASKAGGAHGGTSVSMSAKKPGDAAQGTGGESTSSGAISSGDLFARSISMMAVAHIARGVGFDAVQRSAGDALVDILGKCTIAVLLSLSTRLLVDLCLYSVWKWKANQLHVTYMVWRL